ncbi:MAG: Putative sulfate permease, partial [uncultured Rubrobacteraceae bacterium]
VRRHAHPLWPAGRFPGRPHGGGRRLPHDAVPGGGARRSARHRRRDGHGLRHPHEADRLRAALPPAVGELGGGAFSGVGEYPGGVARGGDARMDRGRLRPRDGEVHHDQRHSLHARAGRCVPDLPQLLYAEPGRQPETPRLGRQGSHEHQAPGIHGGLRRLRRLPRRPDLHRIGQRDGRDPASALPAGPGRRGRHGHRPRHGPLPGCRPRPHDPGQRGLRPRGLPAPRRHPWRPCRQPHRPLAPRQTPQDDPRRHAHLCRRPPAPHLL